MFYNLVAKTLYTTNQARPYNFTAVAFLTTIDSQPNKYLWGNIVHIMNYILETRDIPLILSVNDDGVLKWWIGSYYLVHPNM